MELTSITDLVICGPDMSGTSTQIEDTIKYFQNQGKIVRDMRGTEADALFHAEKFKKYNKNYSSLSAFLKSKNLLDTFFRKKKLIYEINNILGGYNSKKDLLVASMVKNSKSTYINPNSADVWIFEEPTKRGAGQVNRALEQNRSAYDSSLNPLAAALSHQSYRSDEFLRFRKAIREAGKIIVRSRSEESACYQIYDEESLPTGISKEDYINLPGHKIAFSYPPTHIFVVNAPENWTTEQYIELKKERSKDRDLDDHEMNVPYQILVNKRYAGEWITDLYSQACQKYGSEIPEITRFNIYDSKEEICSQMYNKLQKIGL